MEVYAKHKNSRISPVRARKVAAMVRRKDLETAYAILKALPQKGARLIYKVLHSSAANAVNNYQMDESKLYIKRILIDEATPYRRVLPRAMGRADIMKRRNSHITVFVDEREE